MTPARLIIDAPMPGTWNMALDQALLESTDQRGAITLRFYRWSEPTLSLGYFQKFETRQTHAASLDCPIVRRSSGGGAIMHDHELTYSICVPESNRWSKASDQLYDLVHQQVINLLAEHKIAANLVGDAVSSTADNQSFLCFQRRTTGDVVVDAAKVCGSAQRRLRNALLQHGSLLLRTSAHAPELLGLQELTGQSLDYETACQGLADRIATTLEFDLATQSPSPNELAAAKVIERERFNDSGWTCKR